MVLQINVVLLEAQVVVEHEIILLGDLVHLVKVMRVVVVPIQVVNLALVEAVALELLEVTDQDQRQEMGE